MSGTEGHAHLNDDELGALLDPDPAGSALRERLLRRAEGCAACAEMVEETRRMWTETEEAVALADPLPSELGRLPRAFSGSRRGGEARGWTPALRRAAVIAIVVIGALAAAAPVRAAVWGWIEKTFGARADTPSAAAPAPSPAPEPAPSPQAPGAEYRMSPTGPQAVVRFRASAAAGTLSITPAQDTFLTLRSAGPGDPVLALPDGFEVQNSAASGSDYRIEVPAMVRRLEIRVGAERVSVPLDSLAAEPFTISLRRGG